MNYGHINRGDGPGWILGVLVLAAAVIRTAQLLMAGKYGTVIAYAVIVLALYVLIMLASVYMRGEK